MDTPDGRRLARCLRCDAWVEGFRPASADAAWSTLPPLAELPKPRRGKPLDDAVLLRLISIERAVHCVLFGVLAAVLILIQTRLFDLQRSARDIVLRLDGVAGQTGAHGAHALLTKELHKVIDLNRGTLTILIVTALAYCIVEGVEAVGLWFERRWAEYLTVLATAGFLPIEIHELVDRVTVLRVLALLVNLAILVWLVWSKRLFGVRGGEAALHESVDWDTLLAPPIPPEPAPPHPTPLA